MSKFNILTQRELLNPETGEITVVETAKTITTKIKEDSFYMTFIDYISPIYGLKPEAIKSFLAWLCSHAEYNTGKVILNTSIRKDICKELDISNNTITNYLKKLRDTKIISGERGSYIINPKIFWKGELGARRKLLKNAELEVIFNIKDKNVC